jgi:hypothetical protein
MNSLIIGRFDSMLQMLPRYLMHPVERCLRERSLLRYLVHMNWLAFSTLLLMGSTPWPALAQTGAAPNALGAAPALAHGQQAAESDVVLPAAAVAVNVKPVIANDLRSTLQLQKARHAEAQVPERHLSSQERSELRKQLRR